LSGSRLFAPGAGEPGRPRRPSRRERRAARVRSGSIAGGTLLPITAAALVLVLLTTVVVFGVTLHKDPIDALYFAVSTALGNSTLDSARNEWLKGFGVLAMIAGGALLGVVFSFFAAVATTTRLEQRAGRQAQRMSGHAVVAGLGTVGYRVGRLLHDSGIAWAGLDRAPDPRYAEAAGASAPVLTGDVRLPENLERAGIRDAACLFACTDNDLANIEACLQARRLNPGIRTVARIFDDVLASRVAGTFGVDAAVSATRVAAAAFVGAAIDERALRTFDIGGVAHVAFRKDVEAALAPDRLSALRDGGVLILAARRSDGTVEPGGIEREVGAGTTVIVVGPSSAVESSELRPAVAEA
jgi:Trk K+ transport system NAD-binding subunit